MRKESRLPLGKKEEKDSRGGKGWAFSFLLELQVEEGRRGEGGSYHYKTKTFSLPLAQLRSVEKRKVFRGARDHPFPQNSDGGKQAKGKRNYRS